MSQIIISDPVGLREAIEFAQKAGCVDQLGRDLIKLLQVLTVGMTKDGDRKAELGSDFAPLSLRFAIWDGELSRETMLLNGGWIYAGPGAPGDGSGPSFSCDLSWAMGQRPVYSWNVHT
jgi:hypothetical protein